MSKHFQIIMAVLVCLAMAAPAFALNADITGFLQVRGVAYDNLDGNDDVDDNGKSVDERFRMWTNAALNENVKAVFAVEVDYVWGDTGVGDIGADAKGQIEIMNLYLDFNIPQINTNVKAGTQYFGLGRKLILGDNASGVAVRYAISQDYNLGLYYVKQNEGAVQHDTEEGDYYHAQLDMKLGDWAFAPYVGYFAMPETYPTTFGAGADDSPYAAFFGFDADGKMGPLGLALTAIGTNWEAGDADGNGFALWGNASYVAGPTKFFLEAAYYGDEDTPTGEFISIKNFGLTTGTSATSNPSRNSTGGFNNFAEIITGGMTDPRNPNGLGGAAQSVTFAGNPSFYMNAMYVKLGVDHKINEKNSVSAAYIYAQEAEDVSVGTPDVPAHDAITYGHEVDAYYNYAITKGLTFTALGAYLVADDDFNAGDDAWKLGTILTYKY